MPKVDPNASPICRKVATDADAEPSRLLSVVANMVLPDVVSIIAVPHPINVKPPKITRVGLLLFPAIPDRKIPPMSMILPTSQRGFDDILAQSQPVIGEQIGRMPCNKELSNPVFVAE